MFYFFQDMRFRSLMLSDIKKMVTRYRQSNRNHSNSNNQELNEQQVLKDELELGGRKEFEKTDDML